MTSRNDESCEEFQLSKLVDLAAGTLAPPERARAQEHVQGCAKCRAAVRDLSPLINSKEAPPDVAITVEVDGAVMAAVDRILESAGATAPGTGVRKDRPIALIRAHRRRAGRVHVLGRFSALHYSVLALGAAAAAVLVALFLGGGRPEPSDRHAREGRSSEAERSPERVAVERVGKPLSERPAAPADSDEPAAQVATVPPPPAAVTPAEFLPVQERQDSAEKLSQEPPRGTASAPAQEISRPGTSLAYLSAAEGTVEYARGGMERWFRARAGTALASGDRVRTTLSRARIEFESGSVLFVNRWTTLTIDEKPNPPGLSMVGGEVYVEIGAHDKGFWVKTPHGRAVDLGTKFGVEVKRSGTTVIVAEGKVEASTREGRAELATGEEVLLARWTSPPEPVRRAQKLDKRLAWARRGSLSGRPRRAVMFADGFDGSPVNAWPKGWMRHATEAANRSGFVVLRDADRLGNRFIGCPDAAAGSTQHAFVPVRGWPSSFEVTFRMRLSGRQNTRVGIEIEDGRTYPSFEYVHGASVLKLVDRGGRGELKQVPLRLQTGRWTTWKLVVELRGAARRYELLVDDKLILAIDMPWFGPVVTRVSLVTRGADSGQFDDVVVSSAQVATGTNR